MRNGWANEYYAAAVQAGSHSWKAFLFGSLDSSNYITVDKPPASLWLMELSVRLFGLSSFSVLLPQALEGVAAVALLYATVRRWFARPAALLSGLILALTPVAALIFRFNNPDALLVLLLVVSAYAVTRALECGVTRWLALAAAALGLGFLTKELQAFLVLPAFVLVYLVAAPVRLRRRIWQLAVAGGALIVSAGWWVALVELWPTSARPYIGGSTTNSILQLIFGYNGLERITSAGGGPGGATGFSGSAGILRLFNSELGGQISWLLPAAGIVLVAGAAWTARRPRTDRTRAALLLWGGWLIVCAGVYSLMTGVIHPYYTNTLAPAIAALVGVGATVLWSRRDRSASRIVLAAMVAVTGLWSYLLLDRTPAWHPWLRFAVLAWALTGAALLLVGRNVALRRAAAVAGLLAALAGPGAYTLSSVATAESGQNPLAAPAVGSARGPGGGGFGARSGSPSGPLGGGGSPAPRALVTLVDAGSSRYRWVAATTSWQTAASIELSSGKAVMDIGGFSGTDGMTLASFKALVAAGKIHYYIAGGGGAGGGGGGRAGFGEGGVAPPPSGGFPGGGVPAGGPGPVARGLPSGARGADSVASRIESWMSAHYRSWSVGGTTVYDLTQPKAS